jgi:gamma-glutamylcyclotransferase (GGCT)/AIG2-like uncharacterized protein YtfP
MKEYLFSYGTLQTEKVQLELFGRILQGSGDTLRGYRVSTIEIKDESFLSKSEQKYHLIAVVSKDKNDMTKGTVFEITEEELFVADQYEPNDYKRVKVVLESGKETWIYAAIETT